MGIVYRARQRTPSRVVALKMILPAQLNSPGAVDRFSAEAQAAAILDHEGILPIYAVGQHDGAPFYSMKFAEGGPLSVRLDRYRDKPNEAAALIAKLARAVAHAHEHGILHRDLKPGNVLFDVADKPYISDFGLAKWLQRECDLTQTLAILGTPYYMAPEQAKDSRSVTAAADVYSLGAILYHLLTGHPPVAGDTPIEVLQRAAVETPKRPGQANSRIPRDLEIICLKCLEKEPSMRYQSAAALADDLDSFCADRPILARPIGVTNRCWRWIKRNPVIASLAACLIALIVALVWLDEAIRTEEKKPTRNPEAYAIYKKGLEVSRRPSDAAGWEEAQHLFEQAIKLDPQFALAHAQLSRAHSIYYSYYNQSEVQRRAAKTEAEESLRLQPNLGEGHLALATYLSRIEHDYDAALKEFEIARKALPNDPYVFHGSGHARIRRGQFEEAIADYERATVLDPMNWNMWDALGNAYGAVRRFSADEHAKRRSLEVLGDVPPAMRFNQEYSWAMSYGALTGSFEKLDALFARTQLSAQDDPESLAALERFDTRLLERDFEDAEKTLATMTGTIFDLWSGARMTKNFLSGELALAQGDTVKARPSFEAELQFAQQEVREMPDSSTRHAQLGLIYAYLGRKEEAIAAGKHAVELLPLSKDALDGTAPLVNLAQIYARVDEADKAIDLLDELMRTPNGPAIGELQFWFWDPLREHPRFKDLIAMYSK